MRKDRNYSVYDVLSEEELRKILKSLDETDGFFQGQLRKMILRDSETPAKLFEEIYKGGDPWRDIKPLLNSPRTPHEILTKIYDTYGKHSDVIEALLKNSNTPDNVIHSIVKNKYFYPKHLFKIAEQTNNPEILKAVFDKCTKDSRWKELPSVFDNEDKEKLIEKVLSNPLSDSKMIEEAACYKSSYVRACAARNERCPEKILEKLARDSSPTVKKAVISNPKITREQLEKFTKDKSRTVSADARREIDLKSAQDRNTPATVLKEIAEKELGRKGFNMANNDVLMAVASNINTPVRTLEKLSRYSNVEVRIAVTENPKTPDHIIIKMQKNMDKWWSRDVDYCRAVNKALEKMWSNWKDLAKNPDTPSDVLEKIVEDSYKLDDLDRNHEVLKLVAMHENTPDDTLNKLAKTISVDIVKGLILNPNTPDSTLLELKEGLDELPFITEEQALVDEAIKYRERRNPNKHLIDPKQAIKDARALSNTRKISKDDKENVKEDNNRG